MRTEERHVFAVEGIPIITGELFLFVVLLLLHWYTTCGVWAVLVLFSFYFFRNPKRNVPDGDGLIVSPADGIVVDISTAEERFFLKKKALRVSIFMSLFDVHINRFPVEGEVVDTYYNKGKFYPANREKSSLLNEQNGIFIRTKSGKRLVVVQIAGIVARRIVCYAKRGSIFGKGKIFGLIMFGSRLDIYVPFSVKLNVRLGERVKAGETVIGMFDE